MFHVGRDVPVVEAIDPEAFPQFIAVADEELSGPASRHCLANVLFGRVVAFKDVVPVIAHGH